MATLGAPSVRLSRQRMFLLSIIHAILLGNAVNAFSSPVVQRISIRHAVSTTRTTALQGAKYSALPQGISPFEKSLAKGLDVQGNFRKLAAPALEKAIQAGVTLVELDFPPLVGGDLSKTQFDDFDNVQELNANSDWCAQLLPDLATTGVLSKREVWFVLPDDKECELAKQEWTGQRFQGAARFTSIRAATISAAGESQYSKAWGSSIASTVNKMTGGDGILADSSTLDELDPAADRLHLVCQPGNGGPVEDWINTERLHKASSGQLTVVVNGALDKVRDGYYAAVFFPALAATVPFYKEFEPVLVLRPISAKGLYGWLFRVYPEPWQVVLQTARQSKKGDETVMTIENVVALVSETRPTYQQSVDAMLATAATQQ